MKNKKKRKDFPFGICEKVSRTKSAKENFQKAFQKWNDLEVVFQITIDDLRQILLQKDEVIQKICNGNNVQTLKSYVQDSVANEETYEETRSS